MSFFNAHVRRLLQGLLVVVVVLLMALPSRGADASHEADQNGESPGELLVQILELHEALATDDTFLAQAELLSAYMQEAFELEDADKVVVYKGILSILQKLSAQEATPAPAAAPAAPASAPPASPAQSGEAPSTRTSDYQAGAALLEVFKATSIKSIPDVPVLRQIWKRDLECWWKEDAKSGEDPHLPWYVKGLGAFFVPEKINLIGAGQDYVARFSFYFRASQAGRYSFTLMHPVWDRDTIDACGFESPVSNEIQLVIGGTSIAVLSGNMPSIQGIATLEEGFHRVELYLVSAIKETEQWDRYYPGDRSPWFRALVLPPDGFDSVPIAKELMLMKVQDKPK